MPKAQQTDLLQTAGVEPLSPPPGLALAIKADLKLPWNQLRKLKSILSSSCGFKLECEKSLRSTLSSVLPEYVASTVKMIQHKTGAIEDTTIVYLPDLLATVKQYLQLYETNNMLTWHGNAIPPDKIYVKIGGDHGGGSFKFVMQVICQALLSTSSNYSKNFNNLI
eukprot:scpid47651/ scgid30972/ 